MKTPRHHQRQVVVTCLVLATLTLAIVLVAGCTRPDDLTSRPPALDHIGDQIVVDQIVDGDTIVVSFPRGTTETVRLLGVDTPETVDPSRPEQCFGAEATAFVRSLIPPGTPIRLERDIEARDRYGRLLAYVFRADDDRFVNAELLTSGMADLSIYAPNDGYLDVLQTSLRQAKTEAAGLWGACGGPDVAVDPPPVTVG